MEQIHKERFLNLVRACRESQNPDLFDMERYLNECGTPGCAFGNYAARSDLQNAFRLEKNCPIPVHIETEEVVHYWCDEVLDHFGISEKEACELFSGEGCGKAKTPQAAATYIESFVARKAPQG